MCQPVVLLFNLYINNKNNVYEQISCHKAMCKHKNKKAWFHFMETITVYPKIEKFHLEVVRLSWLEHQQNALENKLDSLISPFLSVSRFSSFLKNHHLQIYVRSGQRTPHKTGGWLSWFPLWGEILKFMLYSLISTCEDRGETLPNFNSGYFKHGHSTSKSSPPRARNSTRSEWWQSNLS